MNEKLKVLFIEDSPDDAELLLLELNKGGIEPEWERVDTADALTKALEKQEWDIIISDYAMPGFSGIDALNIAEQIKPLTPFILVSGTVGEETAVEAMKAGAGDYIMKDKLARLVPAIERELKEAEISRKAIEAEKALKERNEELNTFVYKSSHDLRAPLASILGLINVSQMEVKDPEASKYFDLIKDRVLAQDSILADLLRVSGIYKGKIRPEMIDPAEEVMDIIKNLENSEAAKDIQFKLKDGYKKKIKTDRMLFVSIVQNIVSNAIAYKNAAIKKPHVHLELTGKGKGIDITIEDNGIGIPKDIKAHVYDMFYRGHANSSGSGLGLYIVKKSVEKLGGTIRLSSEKGKGSTFSVFLPDMKES